MDWIWTHQDWPHFRYSREALEDREREFLSKAGMLAGAMCHMDDADKKKLTIELISEEALRTSEIEGELLSRESVQSSIQRQFGLRPPQRKISAAEQGIAEMMVDVYHSYEEPLSHERLFAWHKMLMDGRRDLHDIGEYRTDTEPMQIVSNILHDVRVHYEAPPSEDVQSQMDQFITWFNDSRADKNMGALARAGIAHLYFESIHPMEDGNGRIGRALSEKALSQSLGRPTLISLSYTINAHKKDYYDALQRNSRGNLDVTEWLEYFSAMVLEAQETSQAQLDFMIGKAKFYDRYGGQLNERQEKVIARIFKEGVQGFKGGLSAENYIRITDAPRATVTRDLQDLVSKGALTRTGELRYTRYWLKLD